MILKLKTPVRLTFGALLLITVEINIVIGRSLVKPPKPFIKPQTRVKSQPETRDAPTCTELDDITNIITKAGLRDQSKRWKDFNIYLDTSFEKWERQVIKSSMRKLQNVLPCVKFGIYGNLTKPTGDYVNVIKGTGNGCNSHIGKVGGKQDMNLQSPGCLTEGIVIHELLHALGLFHEQSRYDRDDYVDIIWENISPGFKGSFTKRPASIASHYGIPYNQMSIMHYDNAAFSRNGKDTIKSKNGRKVGSTGKLQQTDIDKIKTMYNCF